MSDVQAGLTGIFARIQKDEDAVKIVRAGSLVFVAAGLFFAVVSSWGGFEYWVHGLGYILLGLLLRQFKSRIIASLLFLLAVVTIFQQIRLYPAQHLSAGISLIVAAIVVFVCVRALEATHKLRSKPAKVPVGDA